MATELPAWAIRLRAERRNRFWSQKDMARHLVEAANDDVRARLPSRESIIPGGTGLVLAPTKTVNSERRIALPGPCIDALTTHREHGEREREAIGAA